MKIFLTGATGYIGGAVASAFQRSGHQVMALARSESSIRRLQERSITPFSGDLSDLNRLAQGARESDVVIHTASSNSVDTPQTDKHVVETIVNVLAGSHKPFIYTSGSWVLGNTPKGLVADEETVPAPPMLVAWRPSLEQSLLASGQQGVRSIVLRPGLVYGHQGGITQMFVQFAQQEGVARTIGDGENFWDLVHVDDLADAYVRAATLAPAGTLLNIVSEPPISFKQIIQTIHRVSGLKRPVEVWSPESARQRLGPLVDALLLDQHISGARARSLLNWTPRSSSVLDELEQSLSLS